MSNLSEEEYPLLETKEMANRKRELEKLNKTEIIKKLVATEETLKFYSEITGELFDTIEELELTEKSIREKEAAEKKANKEIEKAYEEAERDSN